MSHELPINRAFLETHGLTPGAADYVMRHFEQELDALRDQRDEELERANKACAEMRHMLNATSNSLYYNENH